MDARRPRRPDLSARERRRLRQERRNRLAGMLPLLAAVFLAAHSAAAAISLTTEEPAYEFVLHLGITLGVALSLLGLSVGRNLSALGGIVMVAAFAAYAVRFQSYLPGVALLYPAEVIADEETSLSALCGWFLVGFSVMQGQRANLVFIFVPGTAMFGLMATRNLNPELIGAFMVFLASSIYCWGYDTFLVTAEASRLKLDWRRWARAHLSGAALVFAIAAVGGAGLGTALYQTTPRMYTGFGLAERIWNYSGAHVQGYFMFRRDFEIGSGPIRLSKSPVARVTAAEPHLWRGRAYDTYNGHGWERSRQVSYRTKRAPDGSFNVREPLPRPKLRTISPMGPEAWGGPGGPGGPPQGPAGPGGPGGPPPRPTGARGAGNPGGPPAPPMAPGGPVGAPNPGMMPGAGRMQGSGPMPPGGPTTPAPTRQEPDKLPAFGKLKGKPLKQTIEVLGSTTNALFAASFPYRTKFGPPVGPIDPARTGPMTDDYGALETGNVMAPGQTYEVWSMVPDTSEAALGGIPPGDYSKGFRERYIDQNSAEVALRLRPIVDRLTEGLKTPYEKVFALRTYLEEHCLYTLNVPFTPVGRDPVVFFVTSSRRGACDLFASAMALMCRLADVPARVATGFNIGEYDASQRAYIVTGEYAHAWCEIHYDGYGWVPLDLTATTSLESTNWLDLLQMGQWRFALRRLVGRGLLGLVLLAALYLASTALVEPGKYLAAWARRWRYRKDARRMLAADYQALLRRLARKSGVRNWAPLTPVELVEAFVLRHPVGPEIERILRDLTRRFYEARYGRGWTRDEIIRLRRDVAQVRRALRRSRQNTQGARRPPTDAA